MKTSEVLRRYKAGERDFRHANLRGQSFKGQDLSGADFSEADVHGANFRNATLRQTRFVEAKAGVQKRWLIVQKLIAFAISALFILLSLFPGVMVAGLLMNSSQDRQTYSTAGIFVLGLLVIVSLVVILQGFTFRAFLAIAFTFSFALLVAAASVVTGKITLQVASEVTVIGVEASAGVVAFALANAVAVAVMFKDAFAFKNTFAVSVALAVGFPVLVSVSVIVATTAASTVATSILSVYVVWRASIEDEKFALVRTISIAIRSIGGTAFCGADLTHADFSKAMLEGANFTNSWGKDPQGGRRERETILDWVCWHAVQKVNCARFNNSILANPAVRDLLVTRDGNKKSYVDAKLRATDLNGVNLEQADLTWADLSGATLRQANLKDANLSESLVLHTDFTRAYMTGACLEAWNVDSQTILDQVDCQYVYLLRNHQERRPSSGDFAPGEFTKLFEEVLSTVDLIFRNGVDWKAFVTAFQQVQVQNEDTLLEVQSIENKGDGVVVVRVSTSPDANKEKIHSEFNQLYELARQEVEAIYRVELKVKDGEIAIYREQNANLWSVINLLASRPINVQVKAEAKAMNDSTDQSQNFKVGGDLNITATNSVVNLRDISGSVTNTINQLPDQPDSDQPNLKDLLIQLQAAIESDNTLPDTDKADLLEQVQLLAEAKQTEEPAQREGLVRKAKKMFDATLHNLPETAKIAEACAKLLPLIFKAFGLLV